MNKRLEELMLEAGYAAPELAGRAQKLVNLVVEDLAKLFSQGFVDEKYPRRIDKEIKNRYKDTQ